MKNIPENTKLIKMVKKVYGVEVNIDDLEEIKESLFYLGRAIFRFYSKQNEHK